MFSAFSLRKLKAAALLTAVNFFLSFVGVFLTLFLIGDDEWSILGLVFALLPLMSIVVFFMRHQFYFVEVKDNPMVYLQAIEKQLIPILLYTAPFLLITLLFVFPDNLEVVVLTLLLSVVTGFRVMGKYALTLAEEPVPLYWSNIISLSIWILGLYLCSMFMLVAIEDRLSWWFLGECAGYFYIRQKYANTQKNYPCELSLKPNRVFLNLSRVGVRQFNYGLPVFLVNVFLPIGLSSQIGMLSRVRTVIDQVCNTIVVSFSKKIIGANLSALVPFGLLVFILSGVLYLVGVVSVEYIKSMVFSNAMVLWFFLICLVWLFSTFLTLSLEVRGNVSSLLSMEIFYSIFVLLSFGGFYVYTQ